MNIIVLAVLLIIGGKGYTSPHKGAEPKNYHAASQNFQGNGVAFYPVSDLATAIDQNPSYQKTKAYLKKAFGPELLGTWILVIAAGIGIWYTIRTLRLLSISTKAAKKAADSAWLNAQAVIYTERPWLIVEQSEITPRIADLNTVFNDLPPTDRDKHTDCIFWIKNYGRTPAIVVAQKTELQIGNHGLKPPDPAFFDNFGPITPYVFPQDTTHPQIATLAATITQADRVLIKIQTKFVWLCGYIRYKDSVPRPDAITYETRFCYVWWNNDVASGWTIGPERYNSHTEHQPQQTQQGS